MQKALVIKLGGAILSCEKTLETLFDAIATFKQTASRPLILVHGGGYLVDELMHAVGHEVEKRNGLRVTPKAHISLATGALAGTANKLLQANAIKAGLNSLGLSLSDAGLCRIEWLDPALGHVGKPIAGDGSFLLSACQNNLLPLISSIGITDDGDLMNVNADDAAVAIAKTLDADLAFLSDVEGVLDAKKSLIVELSSTYAAQLMDDQVITDGMIVKVNAALDASRSLGKAITIAGWKNSDSLTALFEGQMIGTRISI